MSRIKNTNLGVLGAKKVPTPNTTNRQGHAAYQLEDELKLISMLNTCKVEPQAYRTQNETLTELQQLIHTLASEDPYFVAQCIVYSRWEGEGMRTINHIAAALLSPYIAGNDWAKRFYSSYDKKHMKGGCICRPDDMSEIKEVFFGLNAPHKLSMAMKKGFKKYIETLAPYQMFKYKKSVIDISNLVHPNPNRTPIIDVAGHKSRALDALMQGLPVSANTWESRNSQAGQEVATQLKAGKITKVEADLMVEEMKSQNWDDLLSTDSLGILAALRNIRSILKTARRPAITKLAALLQDDKRILEGNVMPQQVDTAYDIVLEEFGNTPNGKIILQSLVIGYQKSVKNLGKVLTGRNLVLLDQSGSMSWNNCYSTVMRKAINTKVLDKAALVAATILKATGGDLICFGSGAKWQSYDYKKNVFELAYTLKNSNLGGTNLASAFDLIRQTWSSDKFDRIFVISDNECNQGSNYKAYQRLLSVCKNQTEFPYVYQIDMAAYGTSPLPQAGKVNYYNGFGYAMFDDITRLEFNPVSKIEEIRKIII